MAVLLRVARRWRRQAAGYVLALYLALYSLGRFFVEGLRVDPAHEIGPLRLNQVVAAVVFALSLAALCAPARAEPPAAHAGALGRAQVPVGGVWPVGRRARRHDHAHRAAAAGRLLERHRAADAPGALAHRVDAAVHAAALQLVLAARRARRRRCRARCRPSRACARSRRCACRRRA